MPASKLPSRQQPSDAGQLLARVVVRVFAARSRGMGAFTVLVDNAMVVAVAPAPMVASMLAGMAMFEIPAVKILVT